jgi:Zn-dependent peptidase ImmA (M78 family)
MRPNPNFVASKLIEKIGVIDTSSLDVEDIIIYHNGIVKEVNLHNCDGRLVMKNGRSIVSIDSKIEFPQRKRFVLAHELGHILMHGNIEASFTDDESTLEGYKKGPQEKEANDFAAEFLIPSDLFKASCFRRRFGPELIKELSEKFNTSLTSIIYRFVDLGNHPIAVFYSKGKKIQYWKKSNDMRYWVPDRSKLDVPDDSVANEFYQFKRIYKNDDLTQEISKSTWFDLGKYDQDTPMYEFCIITPRFNSVVSVIWEK